ncbi:hypothetical protein S40293_10952 [Stachybotrys chartarum IBT 40293]|nr:hypothetical protein S40293_10952 [Stachybotrys chartarum IBT 40293]
MCKFLLQVTLCPCNDRNCSQHHPELNDRDIDVVPQWGHIAAIHSCFRQGPKCPKFFMNDDPNRVLHVYGMGANNPNSRQDCPDKTFVVQKNYREMPGICRECTEQCVQFEDDESSSDSPDGGVYLEFIEDEGQEDGQANPEDKPRGTM